ncbi:type II secretory pathway pseudopilin PulG [Herbaspirillum sp. SJZ102]|nr:MULTISPECIES: secondary type iv prepilin [unclassified Herbaspirillum]MBB5390524.1 type II secretory pathway pseudopilin PulG [Herbaspirillum sp. SJZ102]
MIEVTVVIIVMTAMLAAGAAYLNRYNDSIANELVAGQMRRLGDAAGQYVADNYEKLSSQEGGALLDWRDMKRYLPPGIDQDTVNPFGQRYNGALRVVPLKDDNKRIEVLIFTEPARGAKQPDVATHSMKVAQLIGAGGLYLDHDGRKPGARAVYWSSYGQINDQSSLDGFFKNKPAAVGQIFYAPFMRDTSGPGTLAGDLLHRKKTDGHPEWNKMETDIDMSKHKIDNVASVDFSGAWSGRNPSIYVDQRGTSVVVDPGDGGRIVMGVDGANPTADVLANNLRAGGDVEFGQRVNMTGKKFHSEGGRCDGVGLTMTRLGRLMTCVRGIGGPERGGVWRPVAYRLDESYVGRLNEGRSGSDSAGKKMRSGNWDRIVNNNLTPVTVIVAKAKPNITDACAIYVYETPISITPFRSMPKMNDFPEEDELPIAETAMEAGYLPDGWASVGDGGMCSLTFVARANAIYYVVYGGGGEKGEYAVLQPDD